MRDARAATVLCLLLSGCWLGTKLPPQMPADIVKITTVAGQPPLSRRDIRDKEHIEALVAFVNALPSRWDVPWYGAPVGRVYFEFVSARKGIGNFYVGPGFFGRDTDRHYSQDASRSRIEELGRIVGIDLWAYLNGKVPADVAVPAAAPAAQPAKPAAPGPAAPPKPAAQPAHRP